jgi:hypothetical protein
LGLSRSLVKTLRCYCSWMCTAQPQKRPSNILLFLTGQLRFNKWQSTSPPHSPPPVICSLHKPGKVSFSRVHHWLSPRLGRFFSISDPESPRLFYLPGTYRDPSSSCTTRKSYRRYYTYDCCQTFSLSLARRNHVCRLLKPSNQVEINKSIRLAAGAGEFPISLTKNRKDRH